MAKAIQKRTLQTRAKLLAAAQETVAEGGYAALRVEQVVLRAGVAKGTFFAHFADKDALMDHLIGTKIDLYLDEIETLSAPADVEEMVEALLPMLEFMICERYVFDVILRYSSVAVIEEIGVIAMTFGRQIEVISGWVASGPFRKDIGADLLAEGVQAFLLQAMALAHCALHRQMPMRDRLQTYLTGAWLQPSV